MLECQGRVVVIGHGQVRAHRAQDRRDARLAPARRRSSCIRREASHGDLGMITHDDVVLALSNSGETDELLTILPLIKRQGSRS